MRNNNKNKMKKDSSMEEENTIKPMEITDESLYNERLVEKWRRLFDQDLLTESHLREHWRIWVPVAFKPPEHSEKCYEWDIKENIIQNVLLKALEEFICDENPSDFFSYISANDSPPSVCGKVFSKGEPSYNCRDCSTDATCVLCVSCFMKSPHRYHKYKMGTSTGGGCCDCGDTEAWKSDPHCDSHLAGKNFKCDKELEFAQDLIKRTECVFGHVLKYCCEVLKIDYYAGLPRNLKLKEDECPSVDMDLYCTLIHDHASFSIEYVVSTLASIVKCPLKCALDYVSAVDRDGRTIILCSSFHHCNEVKLKIEKIKEGHHSRPLEAVVIHSHVIAHQMFALRLLNWLLKLTNISKNFRKIFTCVSLNLDSLDDFTSSYMSESSVDKARSSTAESIILQDSILWKAARLSWHRLFISAMFMEYVNKRAFAKIFTNHYSAILKNFIKEDHDYSFSFASLSIQMFTAPTLALHLIAYEDVLFKLTNTFVGECSKKRNELGKLEFHRATYIGSFRRAMYILHDLRYLLHCPPDVWTYELRKGFLKGVTMILNLLTYMQGMNSVTRQVGQHMEYEPEWETAFSLQTKLSAVITLILKWCSTDTVVLLKTFKYTLKKMIEQCCYEYTDIEECVIANHKTFVYNYDVSTQPVSIHLPLSRFLAGLYLNLIKFGFSYNTNLFQSLKKPTPLQMIEPVMRTQVMIAQVHAGLWRKNGYSLSNQIYYYHNVKCRMEMQDKDIVMLQIGATLIDSNEFLILLLNKFKLMNWIEADFETDFYNSNPKEYLKTSSKVVEEFLCLLVRIICERYVPYVGIATDDECLMNEIMHQLFIKPLSHSELNKSLPDDINRLETGMEGVIDKVAIFKKPTQSQGKVVYVVKNELLDKYNVFFHHYSKEDMSKSEEEQRKQKKSQCGLECCPPPVLPHFNKAFEVVLNLLQCDVMMLIIKTTLERISNMKAKCCTEGQLHAALFLIGHALQEQSSGNIVNEFTGKAEKYGIVSLLKSLLNVARAEAYKDLVIWTLNKYKEVTSTQNLQSDSTTITNFLIGMEEQQQEKNERTKLAAEKRANILAQMALLQQKFLKENAQLFKTELFDVKEEAKETTSFDLYSDGIITTVAPLAIETRQTSIKIEDKTVTCILCQEDQTVAVDGPALILASFLQKSTVVSRQRDQSENNKLILGPSIGPAVHLSTCGHMMHLGCWKKYIDTILSKQSRRSFRLLRQPSSFDIERNEYPCPLCQRLSNTILPVLPQLSLLKIRDPAKLESILFSDWYQRSLMIVENFHERDRRKSENNKNIPIIDKVQRCEECNTLDSIYMNVDYEKAVNQQRLESIENDHKWSTCQLSGETLEAIDLFIDGCCKHDFKNEIITFEDRYWIIWKTCAYTIHSLETLLRLKKYSLLGNLTCREKECLENMIRLSGTVGLFDPDKDILRIICASLLNRLFTNLDDSVLEWDSLGILIPLTYSMPTTFDEDNSPLPLGSSIEKHCFKLALLINFAQIIICTDLSDSVYLMHGDITDEDTECLIEIVRIFKDCKGIDSVKIWKILRAYSHSLLRCCVLFYHHLTGVPAAEVFNKQDGETFENLMSYLGMSSSCKQLLGDPCILSIFRKWAEHPCCQQYRYQNSTRAMIPTIQLIKLPRDYSEIINTAISFKCPNSDNVEVSNPTLCLVCGRMLCSGSYCCQTELNHTLVGACTYHSDSCGSGVGVFLRIRDCEILLLSGLERGCFLAAPYLDEYGEVDQGLKRGNPLLLCDKNYHDLQMLWMSHGIPEHIARCSEHNLSIVQQQWHHL